MNSLHGLILTPEGLMQGDLIWEGDRIKAMLAHDKPTREGANLLPLIVPGFIDLHVHGAAGHDFMDGDEAVSAIAAMHARHGTTAMLATTMTAPIEAIKKALAAIANLMRRQSSTPLVEAKILGVHLEGPYLSALKLGAQPPHAKVASLEEIMALQAIADLKVITIAPETDTHLQLIVALREAGFTVQLGHSGASYELCCEAFRCGAVGVTHLFNAMSGFHHRAPGMIGAALAHAQFAEIIPDLLHVHPGAVLAAYRAIPALYAVTDATAAAGMPDGRYQLGEQQVFSCLGAVRLADGTLAGSALTMDQAFRNLIAIGLGIEQASAMLSARPAQILGLQDRGRISEGCHADLVVLERDTLRVRQVVIGGQRLELGESV
ncbi:MAG: N-acetylglucosamine-6-phosphate deacetylase [Burkholderiaceae bacterium]